MPLTALRVAYVLAASGAAAVFVSGGMGGSLPPAVEARPVLAWLLILLALCAVVAGDLLVRRKRIEDISAVYFGVLVGALLGYLMLQAVTPFVRGTGWGAGLEVLIPLAMVYVSVSFLLQTKGAYRFVIPFVEFSRELKGGRPLILDDTALTDGRIAGLVEAGMADTLLIVPDFVIAGVQAVSESADKNRRARGKRGLEVLGKLRAVAASHFRVEETGLDASGGPEAENRLVQIAADSGGRLMTSDPNLTRAAAAREIEVVNINHVAQALKPRFLPGDALDVLIQKRGDNPGQGVGYLDDGTMVVCEAASDMQGEEVGVVVTSVLQSSGGRMIFTKLAA